MFRAAAQISVATFFVGLAGAAICIGTTGGLGIYYDYYLLRGYSLIAEFNQGLLLVADYQRALEAFKPHIELFRNIGGLRFHPLYKTDYTLLLNVFGDPAYLWLYRGVTFALFGWALWKACAELGRSSMIAVAVVVLLLAPHAGFWYVWTTLTATTEGQASAAMSLTLVFYLWYVRRPNGALLVPLALFASIALCFKEPAFVSFVAFAGTHFLLTLNHGERRERVASLVLMSVTCAVGVLYFFDEIWPFLSHANVSYAEAVLRNSAGQGKLALLIGNGRAYIASDPALVFLLFPALGLQVWRLATGRVQERDQRLILAMLVAGAAWFVSLLAIGLPPSITFQYYMVPAYCFALPGIAGQFAELIAATKSRTWSSLAQAGAAVVLLGLSVAPLRTPAQPKASDFLIDNRMEVRNWNKFLDAVSGILVRNSPAKSYIYFYKSPRDGTVELHESFVVSLVARGFLPKDFDLAYATADRLDWAPYGRSSDTPSTPWSWRRNGVARPIRSGDYLVVNSWWPLTLRAEIDALLAEYDLVYATNGNLDCELFRFGSPAYYPVTFLWNSWRLLRGADLISAGDSREVQCPLLSNRKNFYFFRKR